MTHRLEFFLLLPEQTRPERGGCVGVGRAQARFGNLFQSYKAHRLFAIDELTLNFGGRRGRRAEVVYLNPEGFVSDLILEGAVPVSSE